MLIPLKDSKLEEYLQCPVCEEPHHHVKCVGTELDPTGDETWVYPGTTIVFERSTGERLQALSQDSRLLERIQRVICLAPTN
jgi:hypothetical protein